MSKKHFIIFTKEGCPHCVSAKQYVTLHGDTYDEVKVGSDVSRENFLEHYPHVKTMPFILYRDPIDEDDRMEVGGFDALKEFYRLRRDD